MRVTDLTMTKSGRLTQTLRSLTAYREFTLVLVLFVMTLIMTLVSPVFLTRANIEAILLGLSVEATIAIGMVILLISGGLDLSVGSTLAFTGVVTGLALTVLQRSRRRWRSCWAYWRRSWSDWSMACWSPS